MKNMNNKSTAKTNGRMGRAAVIAIVAGAVAGSGATTAVADEVVENPAAVEEAAAAETSASTVESAPAETPAPAAEPAPVETVNVNHFFRWYDKQIFMFFGNEFLHHCGKQIFMSGGKHFFT